MGTNTAGTGTPMARYGSVNQLAHTILCPKCSFVDPSLSQNFLARGLRGVDIRRRIPLFWALHQWTVCWSWCAHLSWYENYGRFQSSHYLCECSVLCVSQTHKTTLDMTVNSLMANIMATESISERMECDLKGSLRMDRFARSLAVWLMRNPGPWRWTTHIC